MKTSTRISGLALLLCLAGFLGFAAPQARADEEKDPPSRVARISVVDGSVSLQPGGEGDWGEAQRNRPMTIGDKLWVDKDSRAELQAGAVTIHIGSMTALSFLNLDEGITQMRLAEGAVNFRVAEMRQGDVVELDAPNLAFTVKQAGDFRVDVNENGDATRVTVIRGEGEIASGGKTYPVHAEEQAEFVGTDNAEPKFNRAPGPDGLDNWAAQRDVREDNSASSKYVPRDMDGYSDLDENGTWNEEPEYGHVWYPNEVDPGWAPYSYGYWANVGPWGWTWVDYAPWGFAPFHYGRWAFIGSRWGWCPGPYFGAAVYGPAFVGWFGGGFGLGVGWFPLGFGEPFFPWFHCRESFVTRINVRNTYIRNNIINRGARNFNYVNAHNVRAVTTMSHNGFVNGQAVNRGAGHITEASLRGAHVSNSAGLSPTRNSSFGAANHGNNVARPSSTVQSRGVVARTSPAHGISGSQVHTMNNSRLTAGRPANANVGARANGNVNASRPGNSGNNGRSWEAQGNATDRGKAPAGFGSSNSSRPNNQQPQAARNDANRPPWARGNGNAGGAPNGGNNRSYTPPQRSNGGSQNYGNNNRSYSPPQRSYGGQPNYGNRGNSQPRTYSAPTRSYPAPQRSYTPPSRGSSGGGASRGSSGGGASHGGGGGSHPGGGSHGGGSHGKH